MPIHLEDVTAPALPTVLMDALLRIADAAIGRAVTPGVAMELLRAHLAPSLPPHCAGLFAKKGQPSWDRLSIIYAELLALSRGEDTTLVGAAFVVDVVWRHSARPARELVFKTVDVSSFLRMAGYAKLAVASVVRLPSGVEVELLRFCKYCWRPARSGAGVCSVHGLHDSANAIADYKRAQRLRLGFERELLALATSEELEFHNSGFAAAVFFPHSEPESWLATRRPALAHAIGSDGDVNVERLVEFLFGSDQLMPLFIGQPYMLTPVTLRAEAWLRALRKKGSWGGHRLGAGAKRK